MRRDLIVVGAYIGEHGNTLREARKQLSDLGNRGYSIVCCVGCGYTVLWTLERMKDEVE